ncbi:MAG TPA: HD domain-containing phosphohydrolase [Gallionellaceae bacterium]
MAEEVEDLYNNAPCGYHSLDRDGLIVRINDTELNWLGYRREELVGKAHITDLLTPRSQTVFRGYFPEFIARGRIRDVELELVRKDGSVLPVLISATAVKDEAGNFVMSRTTVYDMSERIKAEQEQQRLNRALLLLSQCNMTLVHAKQEQELLADICRLAVEAGGYLMAWVGYAEQGGGKRVLPVAQAGFEQGYLAKADISWADNERGQGPTGKAIREGTTQINQNFLTNPNMAPWREAARQRGYQSNIALPLIMGERRGALMIYAAEPNAFAGEEVRLLEELAADLSFGIGNLRMQEDHERMQVSLQQSLEDMVQAIAATLELRDPYTAGHQRRVAQLSMAIAREMWLPAENVHALGLAASIHDLGKIRVPVEILSKPGRISELELELIKRHPQSGYDIIRNIDFPFPIAQWIWQHHERMDGSGYPRGLKGDDILLESRILCVADVVEAIYSHRPYRSGLGIEVALEEILRNRGVLYDARVVDACVTLFRERAYLMPV